MESPTPGRVPPKQAPVFYIENMCNDGLYTAFKNTLAGVHVWVTSEGIVVSSDKVCPALNPHRKMKCKYLGHSKDLGWPKKLDNGRIIHEDMSSPSTIKWPKKKKARKRAYSWSAMKNV